jgi:DNA-binding transcriptional MerR regulator
MKPDGKIEKIYYTIGEVSELFEVNASLIRFWENEFEVLRPQKNKKGNRLFTKEDINTLRIIYHLVKEKGYTLQGARDKMKGNREDVEKQVEVIDSLQRIKSFLLELKKDLP